MTHIEAEADYQAGMKYKEIADKYGVSLNTVKSWKQRHGWERKKGAHKKESMHTNSRGSPKRDAPAVEIPVISDDSGLNDKQRLFVGYYLKYWNATKAYQKAYGCDYDTARNNGSRLLANACVKAEVQRVRDEMFADSFLSAQAIIQKYMDIAFADMTDYVKFGTKEVQAVAKNGLKLFDDVGDPVMIEVQYIELEDYDKVDGTLLSEVKEGKDGIGIKLSDRMKALEKLEKYHGMMSEEQRARVDFLKSKIPDAKGFNPNAQITALADLINNPAPERVLDDD